MSPNSTLLSTDSQSCLKSSDLFLNIFLCLEHPRCAFDLTIAAVIILLGVQFINRVNKLKYHTIEAICIVCTMRFLWELGFSVGIHFDFYNGNDK